MTCQTCPTLKRICCIVACDEMNKHFNRMDNEGGTMDKKSSIHFMAWLTVLFAMAASACCSAINVPEGVNVQGLRGAAKYQAMKEVGP